jgi:hypothetical protein
MEEHDMVRIKLSLNESHEAQADTLDQIYRHRLDVAWKSLCEDIERWREAVTDKVISHHIRQYQLYSQTVFAAFEEQIKESALALAEDPAHTGGDAGAQDKSADTANRKIVHPIEGDTLDDTEFRALVIGLLSSRWALLRQVALQRTPGSPYLGKSNLPELDRLARDYYHRVRDVLPERLKSGDGRHEYLTTNTPTTLDGINKTGGIAPFAPIVYLGSLAALTVFNRQVPLVLTLPMNAIDQKADPEKLSRLAIPHEIGHAILVQVPELREELQAKLLTVLEQDDADNGSTGRTRVLHRLLVSWLDEILADMLGCALADEAFFFSAIWILASAEEHLGLSDDEHPPALVRFFTHHMTLSFLNERHPEAAREAAIQELYEKTPSGEELRDRFLAKIVGNRLVRQFKSLPAVTFLTLFDVRKTLERAVDLMLRDDRLRLEALDGLTIGDLLEKVDANRAPQFKNKLTRWGKIPKEELKQFALDASSGLPPGFHTPAPDFQINILCDLLNINCP